MPTQSARNPAGRARIGVCSSVVAVTRLLLALDVAVLRLDVPARELEEHVVERRLAQGEIAHVYATAVERDRDGAEDRGPVEGPHGQLVAVDVHLIDAGNIAHRVA